MDRGHLLAWRPPDPFLSLTWHLCELFDRLFSHRKARQRPDSARVWSSARLSIQQACGWLQFKRADRAATFESDRRPLSCRGKKSPNGHFRVVVAFSAGARLTIAGGLRPRRKPLSSSYGLLREDFSLAGELTRSRHRSSPTAGAFPLDIFPSSHRGRGCYGMAMSRGDEWWEATFACGRSSP